MKETSVLVIGTQHEDQRHQDIKPNREKLRAQFEELLRNVIEERSISLVAEEAGDDTQAWEHLKREENATPSELAPVFACAKVVDKPQSAIAKQIADEQHDRVTHDDIRPPNAEKMTIEERDEAMAARITEVLGTAANILVICGESDGAGIEKRLRGQGLKVESCRFPQSQ